jgi:hypothetical protein
VKPLIREHPLEVELVGASGRHDPAKAYGAEIIQLLNRVWPVLKARAIPNKGTNWVVYGEGCEHIFAGVEADVADERSLGLERKVLRLGRYAECTHVGPYARLGETGEAFQKALKAMGHTTAAPMVEVYGHWDPDESKLQTTILQALA